MEHRSGDSIERLRGDVSAHARSLTEIVKDQRSIKDMLADMRTDRAVRMERDIHLNKRLDHIEERIDNLVSIGKWILFAFGTSFIAAIATFIIRGGLHVA